MALPGPPTQGFGNPEAYLFEHSLGEPLGLARGGNLNTITLDRFNNTKKFFGETFLGRFGPFSASPGAQAGPKM